MPNHSLPYPYFTSLDAIHSDEIFILAGIASLAKVTGDFTKFLGAHIDQILSKVIQISLQHPNNSLPCAPIDSLLFQDERTSNLRGFFSPF